MNGMGEYYSLKPEKTSFAQALYFLLKMPFSLPSWVVSLLLARIITHIALNPSAVKHQKPVHLVHLSDNEVDDRVIVNLIPHRPHQFFQNYLLKISTWLPLPYLASIKRPIYRLNNPFDKAQIDKMLGEIRALVDGKSIADKCHGRIFAKECIHVKGLEYLDIKLQQYFIGELQKIKENKDERYTAPRKNLSFFSLETPDEAVLDSVAVSTGNDARKPMDERKFIVVCLARDQNYINWLKDFDYSAQKIDCTVIGFNYRGVDFSKGMVWTQQNMINDALSQVHRLLALGAKPENIGLEGKCLGGAVATIAAAKLHEQGNKVKLYNERSFRSIARFITGFICPSPKASFLNPLTTLRYFAAAIVYLFVSPFIWLADWQMDAESAWDRIPFDDKNYSVVRNKDTEEEDGVIEDSWASIASLMDEQRTKIAAKKAQEIPLSDDEEQQLFIDKPESHYWKTAPALKELGVHAHFRPRRQLQNGLNGQCAHDHMVVYFKSLFHCQPCPSLA